MNMHTTIAAAALLSADAVLEAAWQRRLAARAEYDELAVNGDTPAEKRLWAIMDAAEETIRATVATTPRGAMIQLWVALDHSIMTRDEDNACRDGDLLFFVGEHDRKQDWNARLILAALRSLEGQLPAPFEYARAA